jgi:hypothetical protein
LARSQTHLKGIEEGLEELLVEKTTSYLSPNEEAYLGQLLKKKQDLLLLEESRWRLKSQAIWLKEGDNNTKIFQRFA